MGYVGLLVIVGKVYMGYVDLLVIVRKDFMGCGALLVIVGNVFMGCGKLLVTVRNVFMGYALSFDCKDTIFLLVFQIFFTFSFENGRRFRWFGRKWNKKRGSAASSLLHLSDAIVIG